MSEFRELEEDLVYGRYICSVRWGMLRHTLDHAGTCIIVSVACFIYRIFMLLLFLDTLTACIIVCFWHFFTSHILLLLLCHVLWNTYCLWLCISGFTTVESL